MNMKPEKDPSMDYKKAGVDIDAANRLIKGFSEKIASTRNAGSMDTVGGFSGIYDPSVFGVKDPLLVGATDGVGTKLMIARSAGKHDTIGIDLVAMCVNDLICSGARPLFFLDYFACGKLEKGIWEDVVKGIIEGCKQAGCALLGGETAEMPGMYKQGDYDLAGFSVGMLDREKIIDGSRIEEGDAVLGVASSGLHSNGYSLVRSLLSEEEILGSADDLLRPTTIYVKPVLGLIEKIEIKGIANITGGGFYDNIPRILPAGTSCVIEYGSWEIPAVFGLLKEKGTVEDKEMCRTFNMGIGMVLVMDDKEINRASSVLKEEYGIESWKIGVVEKGEKEVRVKGL
jgi:phosphoribosylformylglycinamidine cyclo-ligase